VFEPLSDGVLVSELLVGVGVDVGVGVGVGVDVGVDAGVAAVSGLSEGCGVAVVSEPLGSAVSKVSEESDESEEPEDPGRQMFIPHFTKMLFKKLAIDCLQAVKLKQLLAAQSLVVQLFVLQLFAVQSFVVQPLAAQLPAEVVWLFVVVLASVWFVVG